MALVAGAVIVLQIGLMRVFAVGSWSHFGSVVVSLAMLGFGLASVIMCIANDWFVRHWRAVAAVSLLLCGPLMVASTLIAQAVPFNPVFLVSDPEQKWRLLANFLLYLTPFLAAAFFLGTVFLKAREAFPRVYFADLTGSGIAGLLVLGAMYRLCAGGDRHRPAGAVGARRRPVVRRHRQPRRPVGADRRRCRLARRVPRPARSRPGHPSIAVSPYKGIAYARNFPDAARIYRSVSPFGDLQVYSSSYMHFAPGLSDNAAFNLPDLPANTYVGMYIDGDGPEGIMRTLGEEERDYFFYLPMFYPYVIKEKPNTFVVQFGGGISTNAALAAGAPHVTVAQSNPAILAAFDDPVLREFTGDVLHDPRVTVIPYDGRLFLAHTDERYDVIDLSLADSVGLSNPGGFAIVEKYAYTREALLSYMRALAPGGVLAITLWNKEEPPKSVLKLYATMAEAANAFDPADRGRLPCSSPRATSRPPPSSTSAAASRRRRSSGSAPIPRRCRSTRSTRPASPTTRPKPARSSTNTASRSSAPARPPPSTVRRSPADGDYDPTTDDPAAGIEEEDGLLPSIRLARLYWQSLMDHVPDDIPAAYVFDTRPLTNDSPYFAAYVKPADLHRTLDRLELFQDEWGYLLLWATFAIACALAATLVVLPMIFAWRTAFSHNPGKPGTILYFACLGLGYIMVEVGLIGRFTLALANPTVSATVLIAGMLVFSGLGSLVSTRIIDRAKTVMPVDLPADRRRSSSPTATSSIRCSTGSARLPMAGVW